MQASNDSADNKPARHGHFQEKEQNPATELKIFRRKIIFGDALRVDTGSKKSRAKKRIIDIG